MCEAISLPVSSQYMIRKNGHIEAHRIIKCVRYEMLKLSWFTFEHVYEMASQRLGEFRDARYGHKLEWIIILLLAAEMVWLIAEFLMNLEY